MQIAYLKTFVVAHDAGSFTRAARVLSLSQPAVSQQVRELEAYFGVALFERHGRQVTPSSAGTLLRGYAGRVLSELDDARVDLQALAGELTGRLAIGAGEVVGTYLLPRLIGGFHTIAPHVQLSMRVLPAGELVDALVWRELDLALLEDGEAARPRKGLTFVPFAEDEVVLFVPPEHPLAGRGPVDAAELRRYPLLTRQEGSPTRDLVLSALAGAGINLHELDNPIRFDNSEAMKRAVQAGLGMGFASRFAIEQELKLGLLAAVPINGVAIRRRLWVAAHERPEAAARVVRFQAYLRDSFPPAPLPRP